MFLVFEFEHLTAAIMTWLSAPVGTGMKYDGVKPVNRIPTLPF